MVHCPQNAIEGFAAHRIECHKAPERDQSVDALLALVATWSDAPGISTGVRSLGQGKTPWVLETQGVSSLRTSVPPEPR